MSVQNTSIADKNLDENWVSLMLAARKIGLSKEEVRQFFRECQENQICDKKRH
ncbi:hypothetical protein PAESOLCIP111_04208 [Paenibacillus solanacearum]|uniref:Sin domain-containing protein n=1 Tax=Paenibacillus solanacearum TaxID=2048548 RepID=A0A916NKE5_9BACL|nr:anti-repressor SinI family protein [Paenibacillus solanacearum]CAG7641120.1 hypothetical protein PAESOLCIP111_04208 [Paenibacillus solanacearum]